MPTINFIPLNRLSAARHFGARVLAVALCSLAFCACPAMANTQQTLSKIFQSDGENAAIRFLEEQVAADDISAIHLLVDYYVQKGNAKQKLDEIIRLLERGAKLNDIKSLYLLGNIYSDGNFMQPNIQLAKTFYERAAASGHRKSQIKLAKLPKTPKIVPPPQAKRDTPDAAPKSAEPPVSPPKPEVPEQEPIETPKPEFPAGYSTQPVTWPADKLDRYKIRGFGSGFALSGEGVIATNEHVIDGCQQIFAVYQSKPKRARLLFANKAHDFAVIKIRANTPSFFHIKRSVPDLGEALISGGYPSPRNLGAGIKITTGVVSSEEPRIGDLFQHTTPTQPGNSGGPLVNKAGHVVGISTSVYGEKIGELAPQNINFAVSQKTIQHNLKKWNLRFSEGNDSVEFPTTLLADMLKRSTAQIICY